MWQKKFERSSTIRCTPYHSLPRSILGIISLGPGDEVDCGWLERCMLVLLPERRPGQNLACRGLSLTNRAPVSSWPLYVQCRLLLHFSSFFELYTISRADCVSMSGWEEDNGHSNWCNASTAAPRGRSGRNRSGYDAGNSTDRGRGNRFGNINFRPSPQNNEQSPRGFGRGGGFGQIEPNSSWRSSDSSWRDDGNKHEDREMSRGSWGKGTTESRGFERDGFRGKERAPSILMVPSNDVGRIIGKFEESLGMFRDSTEPSGGI